MLKICDPTGDRNIGGIYRQMKEARSMGGGRRDLRGVGVEYADLSRGRPEKITERMARRYRLKKAMEEALPPGCPPGAPEWLKAWGRQVQEILKG